MESFAITRSRARRIWLRAQKLDTPAPFGSGPEATPAAIRHLGYVQIDTIHVIERCHHHILFARIPEYRREHLHRAQSLDKTVFEYWTHALSYIPVEDMRYYVGAMRRYWRLRGVWSRRQALTAAPSRNSTSRTCSTAAPIRSATPGRRPG